MKPCDSAVPGNETKESIGSAPGEYASGSRLGDAGAFDGGHVADSSPAPGATPRVSAANDVCVAIVDIDGCLTPGVGQPWNWEVLRAIGDLNRRAQAGESVPAVTLCTGRSEPYVEVLMQAIGAHLPGVYENGCGLYLPNRFRFAEHPSITAPVREVLAAAKKTLYARVVETGLGYFQPGKEVSLTLFPQPGTTLHRLHGAVADLLVDQDALFTVQRSASCVDVTPAGIDKGTGVRWLSEVTGIPLTAMGGIGDSSSDLRFLRLVGQAAAPANAEAEVKAAVGYTSPLENGDGVLDILCRWAHRV